MKRRGFLGMIGSALALVGLPVAAKREELTPVTSSANNVLSDGYLIEYLHWGGHAPGHEPVEHRRLLRSKAEVEGMMDALMIAGHDMHELRDLVGETHGTVTGLKITAL